VTGGIDDIDLDMVIEDGGVLGKDGDAALAFQLVTVHYALRDRFVGAEGAALLQHGVHKGGLAMVNVRNNGDVTDCSTQNDEFLSANPCG